MGFGVCCPEAFFIAPYTILDTKDLPTPYPMSNFFSFFLLLLHFGSMRTERNEELEEKTQCRCFNPKVCTDAIFEFDF